jgi:hypothetical protein
MDWALIFKVVAFAFAFLAVEALAVHLYIRRRGGNQGRRIVKVLLTCYVVMICFSAVVGSVTYFVLAGLN